jgi:hypothetical protein
MNAKLARLPLAAARLLDPAFACIRHISKACDILDDHISRTKHFHARVNWSSGRSHRKDYKFRDYSAIFAD